MPTFYGDQDDNAINGSDEDDVIVGYAGSDTLHGGGGNDAMAGDYFEYGFGTLDDTLYGDDGDDLLSGENGNDTLYGGAGNDSLNGGGGSDYLYGGDGDDDMRAHTPGATFMYGGAGDDDYSLYSYGAPASFSIFENPDEGIDWVSVDFSFTLPENFENLIVLDGATGTGNELDNYIRGERGNETLIGLAGNDTLIGDAGTDILIGGTGDDTYWIQYYFSDEDVADTVTELAGEGNDTLYSDVDYVLPDNVENLILTNGWSQPVEGTGNAADNHITGNDADNDLRGMDGNDVLDGGKGNDSLDGGNGDDQIYAGSGNADVEGGDGFDTLYISGGTGESQVVLVDYGDDLGDGYDHATYQVTHDGQTVTFRDIEKIVYLPGNGEASDGIDTEVTLTADSVAVEMLRLADEVYGPNETLSHLAEPLANTPGHAAATSENVAASAVSRGWHAVSAPELGMPPSDDGDSLVQYSFAGGVYQAVMQLDPSKAALEQVGATPDLSEANAIVLSGIVNGEKTLAIVFRGTDQVADVFNYQNFQLHYDKFRPLIAAIKAYLQRNPDITEVMIGGHSLGAGMVEYLLADLSTWEAQTGVDAHLSGFTAGSPGSEAGAPSSSLLNIVNTDDAVPLLGTLSEAGLATRLAIANAVSAGVAAKATEFGDTLFDFAETATFVYQSLLSVQPKPRDGSTVYIDSGVSGIYGLDEHGSNLYTIELGKLVAFARDGDSPFWLSGLAAALDNDEVYAGPSVRIALGQPFFDTTKQPRSDYSNGRYGTVFSSVMTAEAEDDFVLANNDSNDTINVGKLDLVATGTRVFDGGTGSDRLVLPYTKSSYTLINSGAATTVQFLGLAGIGAGAVGTLYRIESILFRSGLTWLDGHPATVQIPASNGKLAPETAATLPVFTLSGGFDYADAGDGNMQVVGTAGADVVYLGTGSKTVLGNDGDDIIIVKADLTTDLLTIDGGAGADLIIGGQGNETYIVDSLGDRVSVDAATGLHTVIASVDFALSDNLQNLQLTGAAVSGFGNGLANSILGNSQDNLLLGGDGADILNGAAGSDYVDGGAGADKMTGGLGNDTFVVDNALDKVVESNNQGTDTIETSIAFALTGLYVENLTLTGTGNFNIGGNGFNNVLVGNGGNNSLNGGLNADTMSGGAGNDLYFVDNVGDVVVEKANEGKDAINASITYTLGDNVETLVLIGYQAINGTGNALDNTVTGNGNANVLNGGDGKDILIGQGGNDTLTGGNGADQFRFYAAGAANGLDHVTDFVSGVDKLAFTAADYGFAKGHVLTSAELHVGAAVGTNGQFLYNSVNHILYWDKDGSGGNAAVAVAQFDNAAKPVAGDFVFL